MNIVATITVDVTEAEASTITDTLNTKFGTAADASQLLSIQVESEPLIVAPPSPPPLPASPPSPQPSAPPSSSSSDGVSVGIIAGAAAGGAVILIALVGGYVYFSRRGAASSSDKTSQKTADAEVAV